MTGKTKKPVVSVIVPTFNRAWIVKNAIDSILSQDFHFFEIIIVDDGSSDNTSELLAAYHRDDIRIIRQTNLGVSAARNRGVAASIGQYIAFLDSDDMWMPNKLSVQLEFFRTHPKARICQTEEIWIRNGIRVNPKKRHKKPCGMIFEPSLDLCLVSPSAVMMKRSLFKEMDGFDESLRVCEDYDLWLRISCKYPVYLIDIPLIIKRGGHNDQISKAPGLDKFRIQSIVKIIESNQLSPPQFLAAKAVLQAKCRIYGEGCRKRGRWDEAVYYDKLAERYH